MNKTLFGLLGDLTCRTEKLGLTLYLDLSKLRQHIKEGALEKLDVIGADIRTSILEFLTKYLQL